MSSDIEIHPEGLTPAPIIRVSDVSKSYGIWSSPKARLAHPLLNALGQIVPLSQLGLTGLENRMRSMYREFHALRDISFEIKKGESWGFIGVNGSGKSTLLKIISGNLRPTSGSVEVEGKVAILDYSSGINGEFTGRENVYLKASILGLTRKQIDERFASIAAFADIGDFMEQPVKTYSSGMGARLGFAIMAHVDADIMITDEALAVGDAFFVQKCMNHIRAFIGNGTFLFVSHAINDVMALCQKAVWLEHGRIRAIGPANEVADAYISSATLKTSRQHLKAKGETVSAEAPGTEAGNVSALDQPRLSELMHAQRPRVVKDPRLEYLNRSPWRNDVRIPEFDMNTANFGVGGAKIENVTFEDESGATLSWVIGGEMVHLRISVRAERDIDAPIVGFQFRDRLGQSLFADNTFLVTVEQPFTVAAGELFQADFHFQIPMLPAGEYMVRAAVALGTEFDLAMLQCIDNALLLRSVSSGARHGLVGVPMLRIALERLENQ